ncbi:MAG: hypothetical protein AB7K09_23790 [Planctomycetota bacterium]
MTPRAQRGRGSRFGPPTACSGRLLYGAASETELIGRKARALDRIGSDDAKAALNALVKLVNDEARQRLNRTGS